MEGDLTEHGIVNIWFMPTAYHTNLIIGRTTSYIAGKVNAPARLSC